VDNAEPRHFCFRSLRAFAKARLVSVPPLLDRDLVVRRMLVKSKDVVFVKGVFEASEGLCCMFAERGGELVIAAPRAREAELDVLLTDLVTELGAVLDEPAGGEKTVG
jgi:hypothetical protein